jgi:hypothetical protein
VLYCASPLPALLSLLPPQNTEKVTPNIIFQQQDDYNNNGKKGQVFLSFGLDFLPAAKSSELL